MLDSNPRKLIYLACPYSHKDPEVRQARYEKISKIAAALVSKGIHAFSPITYGHTLIDFVKMPGNWEFWQEFCLVFLQHADELWVYKFEDWEKSMGIRAEIDYATLKKIPIKYLDHEEEI